MVDPENMPMPEAEMRKFIEAQVARAVVGTSEDFTWAVNDILKRWKEDIANNRDEAEFFESFYREL